MKNGKRILKVVIKRMADQSPDTSWLGEYSNRPTSEYSIDRAHAADCASLHPLKQDKPEELYTREDWQYDVANDDTKLGYTEWVQHNVESHSNDLGECDCGEHGDMSRGEYRYFNPSFNYVDEHGKIIQNAGGGDTLTPEEVRKYVRQDYERMERLNRGDWCFIGIRAEAEVVILPAQQYGRSLVQEITSGGLWGIEGDSDREYLASVAKDELAELKTQLLALGFSKRAIATAFKSVEEKEE